MRVLLAGGVGLALGWLAAGASAQEMQWRSAAGSAPAAVRAGLGRPVPMDGDRPLTPASYTEAGAVGQSATSSPAPTLGQPIVEGGDTLLTAYTASAPPPAPPPDAYNCGPVATPPPGGPFANPIPPPGGSIGTGPYLFGQEWLGTTSSGSRKLFQSDHCFDNFISPVTNPFLFEDPRSLTEVRPIFMFQATPNGNYLFKNGNAEFLGLQARVAVTDRLSFVINKFGATWQDPQDGMGILGKDGGWSELWLGPKYTFIRNDSSGTLLAGGLQFQIPEGSSKVEQNTGSLSLAPYVSFAQNFGRNWGLPLGGSFNFVNTTGYAFSVDNGRTDYFYSSFHLDYDIAHKIYPLIELNWFQYTQAGRSSDIGFEGRDLFNFGSQGVSGIGTLTIAPGVRYKITENAQVGLAFEFPLVSPKDLVDFRMTIDFILRY